MASDAVSRLGGYGVAAAHVVEHPVLDDYAPDAYADAVTQLVDALRPEGVLAPGTDKGNELLAHVAARTDLPMAANCTDVQAGDEWTLTRLRWGGSLLEEAGLTAPVKLVTMAPHAYAPALTDGVGDLDVHRFTPELDDGVARTKVRARTASGDGASLASAQVVVAGGRGVGNADGFALLEELAGLLDGAVGCSRVATNNGWRSHNDQVGQTGTKIAPQLYIACGISGATQHWVGCKDAKHILAINTDPEAPLVTRGNSAVIGSLHDVLPAVIDEVRRRADAG
jgi:electron transfer flavoprotein alpha subunit